MVWFVSKEAALLCYIATAFMHKKRNAPEEYMTPWLSTKIQLPRTLLCLYTGYVYINMLSNEQLRFSNVTAHLSWEPRLREVDHEIINCMVLNVIKNAIYEHELKYS